MKVHCTDCKFLRSHNCVVGFAVHTPAKTIMEETRKSSGRYYCVAPIGDTTPRKESNWLCEYTIDDAERSPYQPHILNANNDCPHFKQKEDNDEQN